MVAGIDSAEYEAMRRVFPTEVVKAAKAEAEKARKSEGKNATRDKDK